MEEEEARHQIKRGAVDEDGGEAEEGYPSSKRLKPPPTRWWWEDEATATAVLHGVRKEQATLYDPKLRGFDLCRGFDYHVMSSSRHGAVFDFDHDEESTDRVARQLDTIPESERDNLQLALNVLHLKVLASDVGFPISVYGTVLMRDELDFKCIYLFQRDRDNCQVISAPDELLTLTGPNRGPFEATSFYFEINIKIRGGEEQSMDRIFSRTLACEYYPLDQWTHKQEISSWLSTLELACRSVHYAVEATVGITILRGPREFYGSVIACTSQDSNDMVLYESQRSGAHVATAGADGSVTLPRQLVVLREDEDLVLKITTVSDRGGHRAKSKTTVLTVGHGDTSFDIKQQPYRLQATVSWAGIL
ncbi:hypothetical protein BS78_07G104400 [Paspalum vaginatum]|nr:hypothetical protein BS78_07G104400 [Paspalum vaginatum]